MILIKSTGSISIFWETLKYKTDYVQNIFGLTHSPCSGFPCQLHFKANTVFMSSELQLISLSNRQDLQQLTGRESSLAAPATSRAISPLSSINLTVDIAPINLAPSILTLADLIQTAVQSLLQTPVSSSAEEWEMEYGGVGWRGLSPSGERLPEAREAATSRDARMST